MITLPQTEIIRSLLAVGISSLHPRRISTGLTGYVPALSSLTFISPVLSSIFLGLTQIISPYPGYLWELLLSIPINTLICSSAIAHCIWTGKILVFLDSKIRLPKQANLFFPMFCLLHDKWTSFFKYTLQKPSSNFYFMNNPSLRVTIRHVLFIWH